MSRELQVCPVSILSHFRSSGRGRAGYSDRITDIPLDLPSELWSSWSSVPIQPWHYSNSMNDSVPTSMIIHTRVNPADAKWVGSFPENICARSRMDFELIFSTLWGRIEGNRWFDWGIFPPSCPSEWTNALPTKRRHWPASDQVCEQLHWLCGV